jgi:hypothetical protein
MEHSKDMGAIGPACAAAWKELGPDFDALMAKAIAEVNSEAAANVRQGGAGGRK